jgi:Asp-tRNA(Asn)/Glu-tRNA(Gln) amidotransferase A subunit family amidase
MEGHTPSASGVVGLGASIGPMARHVKDVALLFRVLANPADREMSARGNPRSEEGLAVHV